MMDKSKLSAKEKMDFLLAIGLISNVLDCNLTVRAGSIIGMCLNVKRQFGRAYQRLFGDKVNFVAERLYFVARKIYKQSDATELRIV